MLPITKFLLFIMAYYIILFITTLLSAVSGVGEGGGGGNMNLFWSFILEWISHSIVISVKPNYIIHVCFKTFLTPFRPLYKFIWSENNTKPQKHAR